MTRGEHMREARLKAGMSIPELTFKAGIGAGCLGALERGANNGNITTIEMLADALGISIDEYIGHKVGGKQ